MRGFQTSFQKNEEKTNLKFKMIEIPPTNCQLVIKKFHR